MMMYKKIIASGLLWAALTAPAGAFDYNQSVDEIAANPLTAYQTVYLGMPRADFDGNFSVLSDWTFYGSTVSFTEKAERTSVVKNVSVTEGIEIFSADTSAKGRVLAFDNYFKTKDKATAKSIYTRLVATIIPIWKISPSSRATRKWNGNKTTSPLPSPLTARRTVTAITSSTSAATTIRS